MKRRFRTMARGVFGLGALGVSLGCGWVLDLPRATDEDDVKKRPSGDGSTSSGGAAESGGSSSGGAASAGGEGGTIGVGAAGALVNECDEPCDCDRDGEKSEECGGDDCDDHDARVFPGQTKFFSSRSPNPAVGFDFDCSGGIERPSSQAKVECAALSLGTCETAQGFHGVVPPCGDSGSWGSCEPDVLSCKATVLDSMKAATCH